MRRIEYKMKKYEGMFIIKPGMADEDAKKAVDSIGETITKNGGKIERCEKWASRRLAYPIKKFYEGEYHLCVFEAEPKSITSLKGTYRLNEDILRVLITVKE